jgi:polar amino acid transport system substrate-binding protein
LAELNNPQMADRAKRFLPKMKTLDFDQPSSLFIAVKSGQAQAMQIDTPIIDWYAANNPGFHELPELLSNVQNNAIFMKPGDFVWWRYLDTVVQELRWGSRYDEYTALYQKWFKKNPPPQRPYLKQG